LPRCLLDGIALALLRRDCELFSAEAGSHFCVPMLRQAQHDRVRCVCVRVSDKRLAHFLHQRVQSRSRITCTQRPSVLYCCLQTFLMK
jgi:hypothetical protein